MVKTNDLRGEPLTVLLVEDNADHTELILRSLRDHRVANRIFCVTDGKEALDYLLRRGAYTDPAASPCPHVVLLDLRLPKVDGLEVLKEIRTRDELTRTSVVILTTSRAEQDVARAYKYHANSYLVKPVDFDSFTRLMDDLGFYWLGWNHYPWSEAGG
ncbi:MAG: response regulator [Planctomycetota bacterium]|nr:response regulator [Planctomycetota bacterium]